MLVRGWAPRHLCEVSWSHVVTCEHSTQSLCVQSCCHMDTVSVTVCAGITWSHVVTPGHGTPVIAHTVVTRTRRLVAVHIAVVWSHAEMVPGHRVQSRHVVPRRDGAWSPCAKPSRGLTQRWCPIAMCRAIVWSRRDGAWSPCAEPSRGPTQRWCLVAVCRAVAWSHAEMVPGRRVQSHRVVTQRWCLVAMCRAVAWSHSEMVPGRHVQSCRVVPRRDGARLPCAKPSRGPTQRWCLVTGCAVVMGLCCFPEA
ncbi:uncharacterized protein LOC129539848 [Moschus berezovskii]|uniref:uncharacterized protein LOC129539848 n=1 Tax=Moschus berezovskii TaxID=68408 RepID=UPI0024439082|nr:uncharacterized protein LOC129539848 [Moschus berezovskii]